jgi:hypothetical protein
MPEIVLTEEQARIVAEASEPVTVLNPAREVVGVIYPKNWRQPTAPPVGPGGA